MRADTNCKQLATFIVSSMQGAFLLAKAQRDPAPVVNLKEVLFWSCGRKLGLPGGSSCTRTKTACERSGFI
ncbi:hypothetical protein [Paraburkholderia sp. BL6669N2]|uniref:LmrA/YxaF family transcription factor n=1 Tax=Paraburkholderia sp. BL6669N2 TaxID=1938807 RepID=UPI0038D46FDC